MKYKLKYFWVLIFIQLITLRLNGQEVNFTGPSVNIGHGRLIVHNNGRMLSFEDGTPFFYLGDTAWDLFHRLNYDEANKYLENRRQKGFTVIQASVTPFDYELLDTPNAYGEAPFVNENPLQPNEKYFENIDNIIRLAEKKGLFVAIFPVWGSVVKSRFRTKGPIILSPGDANKYGKWIGERYSDFKNIIWVLGGDCEGGDTNFDIWNEMARGIKEVDPNHLMTYHPWEKVSSSSWFQDSKWLDFNMTQSGHSARYLPAWNLIDKDYALSPIKPTLDAEPNYEQHPINWNPVNGYFNDEDVRRQAYYTVFSGACGVTYGGHPIFQFYDGLSKPFASPLSFWTEALDLPGAWDMGHLRHLMESRDYFSRVPDSTLIVNQSLYDVNRISATHGKNYIFIYTDKNKYVKVNLGRISGKTVVAWWFNPRNGAALKIGEYENKGQEVFTIPEPNLDWILVIDDKEASYAPPGSFDGNK